MEKVEERVNLLGRLTISGTLTAKTGLFIGGNNIGINIGGVDQVVIRNALTGEPYIPGSSLKGKMRSLLERAIGRPQNKKIKDAEKREEQVKIHTCKSQEKYDNCPVCNIFGITPAEGLVPYPTRLLVRDAHLTISARKSLKRRIPTCP